MVTHKKVNPIGYHLTSRVFLRILQCSGIWFPDETSYCYSFYAAVLYIFGSLSYAVFTVVYLCRVKKVDDATQALFMLTIIFSMLTKTTNLIYFNKRIRKLFHRIHNEFDLYNENERNLVNQRLRSFLKVLFVFLGLCTTCITLVSITSPFKAQLPFPTWHPLDWKNDKLSYWLAWGHISGATYLALGTNGGVQMFSSYLMFFVKVLMEVLGQRLCSLWSTATVDSDKKLNKKLNKKLDQKCTDKLEDSANELVECARMHQQILEVINEYKICFSYILLYDICSTALGVCSTVYQLVMVSNKDLISYSFLITFLLIQNGQIFLPCYFGNEIIVSSNDLFKHSYFSNWMDMPSKSKSTFLYLMERLKCGSQIVVGKLFPLSLETYTTICLHAYRLFTLLQSMNE